MKRTAKIAFPNITFTDSLTSIYSKFYKYISAFNKKILEQHRKYI